MKVGSVHVIGAMTVSRFVDIAPWPRGMQAEKSIPGLVRSE